MTSAVNVALNKHSNQVTNTQILPRSNNVLFAMILVTKMEVLGRHDEFVLLGPQ